MEKKTIIFAFALILFIGWHWFEPASRKNSEGIKAFEEKQYNRALEKFLSAKGLKPNSVELINNTASSLYNLKKFEEALEEFSNIDPEKTGLNDSDFFYNMGNTFFRLNKFEEALENYKKSLILNPDDIDAKKNYELTRKKLEEKNDQNDKKDNDKEKTGDDQEKYQNLLNYLNQKEKEQMKKKVRKSGNSKKTKDW